MRVLFASSEVNPYMKVGGLADVAGSLPGFLAEAGCDVHLVMPKYETAKWNGIAFQEWGSVYPPMGYGREEAQVYYSKISRNLTLYAVRNGAYFAREKPYDSPDDMRRFMFFAKACYELARALEVDVVHANDWHTGLLPVFCRVYGCPKDPGTVITIHNLAFQGEGDWDDFLYSSLPWDTFNPGGVEYYGKFNILKAAMMYADRITTVSPTYSREIQTPEFGMGLEKVLMARRDAIRGILNGIDYDEWNPMTDALITSNYDVERLDKRIENKRSLAARFGLEYRPETPVFGFVGRLFEQKGVDILIEATKRLVEQDVQVVVLGTGAPQYEEALRSLSHAHPGKVGAKLAFSNLLAHEIYAGADFFLMPSKFEPCGLGQLIAMRYGAIPIVRAVGGLRDTVTEPVTGLVFWEYSASELHAAMERALEIYDNPEAFLAMRIRCMTADYSWGRSRDEYVSLYKEIAPGR
ncbi:MAG TPA: glycogen/starch synthase [Bacillota bacterium]|jgi:starch synthase|nr:glycogen synthase [Bacillota bacterium]HOB41737.1 glycogen/starch synthase [Bacillota bacterium]HOO30026.1 glycogen/starch synthase [Bacillota bacterium]HPQ02518.1 glycogen/starch synthase [Bacillota bacterium]HPZ14055.1 glycogen/starch synthase [Bacillota bacterium]